MERRGGAGGLQREPILVRMVELGLLLEGDSQTEHEDKKLILEGEEEAFQEAVIAHEQSCGQFQKRPVRLVFRKWDW